MRQDFSVTIPATVRQAAAACRMLSAYLAEEAFTTRALGLPKVQLRVGVLVPGREAELSHSVHLHKRVVKLQHTQADADLQTILSALMYLRAFIEGGGVTISFLVRLEPANFTFMEEILHNNYI